MQRHISTTKGLLIVLAAAVLIGGGALTYFYVKSPTEFDLTFQSPVKVSKTADKTKDTATTNPDLKSFTSDLGFSFQYSKSYGTASAKYDNGETGKENIVQFSNDKKLWGGSISKDFSAGRSSAPYEIFGFEYKDGQCRTKAISTWSNYYTCKEVNTADNHKAYLGLRESFDSKFASAYFQLNATNYPYFGFSYSDGTDENLNKLETIIQTIRF